MESSPHIDFSRVQSCIPVKFAQLTIPIEYSVIPMHATVIKVFFFLLIQYLFVAAYSHKVGYALGIKCFQITFGV